MKKRHDISAETEKKLNSCASAEDVRKLMDDEEIELSLDDLEKVSGGERPVYKVYDTEITSWLEVVTINGKKYFKNSKGELLDHYRTLTSFTYGDDEHLRILYYFPDGTWKTCCEVECGF